MKFHTYRDFFVNVAQTTVDSKYILTYCHRDIVILTVLDLQEIHTNALWHVNVNISYAKAILVPIERSVKKTIFTRNQNINNRSRLPMRVNVSWAQPFCPMLGPHDLRAINSLAAFLKGGM